MPENDRKNWYSLISETQFATQLIRHGVQYMSRMQIVDSQLFVNENQRYILHVGLLSFTNGIERLSKLVLACYNRCTVGTFRDAFEKTHKISQLLDTIEELDLSELEVKETPNRPQTNLHPEAFELIDKFAAGAGRYEYLDMLDANQTDLEISSWWRLLASEIEVPDFVEYQLSLRSALIDVLYSHADELEPLIEPYITHTLDPAMDPNSTALALKLAQEAMWVAQVLASISTYAFYKAPDHKRPVGGIPYLPEVLVALLNDVELYLETEILEFGDASVIAESIGELYEYDVDVE